MEKNIDPKIKESTTEKVEQKVPKNYNIVKEGFLGNFSILDQEYLSSRGIIREYYTDEEIKRIIADGSHDKKVALSRYFFNVSGFYNRIIYHYGTIMRHVGMLIPNSPSQMKFSQKAQKTKYNAAINYIEDTDWTTFLGHWSLKAVMDGAYYGIIKSSKEKFLAMDLPTQYCRSINRDMQGNDIVEFNVAYFSKFKDEKEREAELALYPPVIVRAFRQHEKQFGGILDAWVIVPSDIAIHFSFFGGAPPFLGVIAAILEYGETTEAEMAKLKDEVRKILIQTIPFLNDGTFLLEPPEAETLHEGSVAMMADNPNVAVLTTYAPTEVVTSKTSSDTARNTSVQTMAQHVYNEAGVSGQLFSTTNSQSTKFSVQNDIAFMMYLENQFAKFITNLVNYLHGNVNMNFKYKILPVSLYNESEYITNAFKLATGGYSLLLPALAMGFSQRDLVNIKELEDKILKLEDKLVPLASSYNQAQESSKKKEIEPIEDTRGRPKSKLEDKNERTVANEESKDGGTDA